MSASLHDHRFPNESSEYRAARDALLQEEIRLRRQLEEVAVRRRELPLGGEIPEDYIFQRATDAGEETAAGPDVRMSELFRDGKETLLVYSFMFGPRMKAACSSCTSILDGLDGEAPHVTQRVNMAVVAKSPPQRIRDFARSRGWRHLQLLSSAGNSYNADYFGEGEDDGQWPMLNVFVRRNGRIHHFYGTELLFAPTEPGQDGRHVDLIWPLWNLFDYTPEGRGTTWNPRLSYER